MVCQLPPWHANLRKRSDLGLEPIAVAYPGLKHFPIAPNVDDGTAA